jgi:hypothetical protein
MAVSLFISASLNNKSGVFANNPFLVQLVNQGINVTNTNQTGRQTLNVNTSGVPIDFGQIILPRYIWFYNGGTGWVDIYPATGSPETTSNPTIRLQPGDVAVLPLWPSLTGLICKAQMNTVQIQYAAVDS